VTRVDILAAMSEKAWQAQVVELAQRLGYSHYHTYRSKRSPAGWPDLALVRDRLILAELKRETTKPSALQVEWLDRLAGAGAEVYLWRPSDLDEIAEVLARRWTLIPGSGYQLGLPYGQGAFQACWTPRSMWIAGQGLQRAKAA
jgi:hypothetical protein